MNGADERLRDLEVEVARLQTQIDERDKQIIIASNTIDRRLTSMNQLRDQITAERTLYVTYPIYNQKHEELERRIGGLEKWTANVTGRGIGIALVGAIFVAVVAAVGAHLIGGAILLGMLL